MGGMADRPCRFSKYKTACACPVKPGRKGKKHNMHRIHEIQPPDAAAMKRAAAQWDGVAKPLHSLGLLEEAIIKIAGMTGNEKIDISKRCVIDLCADNGVVCEGVTQTDASVTRIVAQTMAEGSSNINRMAEVFHADVFAADVGMLAGDEEPQAEHGGSAAPAEFGNAPSGLFVCKAACGTNNIAAGAAMTREQALQTIQTGIDLVQRLAAKGYRIIVTGEMGIGNTTTSSAIASVLLGLPVEEVTGRGAGLSREGVRHKCEVIRQAIRVNFKEELRKIAGEKECGQIAFEELCALYEKRAGKKEKERSIRADAAVTLLERLGGFDIAAMAGVYLGGAIYRVPVVIDGFISAVAAAVAAEIEPMAKEYMLASHVSSEPAGIRMLSYLGLTPCITAGLCLGEGTGGVLLLPLLDAALAVYRSSHRFDALAIESYQEFEA